MAEAQDIKLTVGDKNVVYTVRVRHDDDKSVFVLTGYDTPTLLFPNGTSPSATVAISDAANGLFTITAVEADTTTAVERKTLRVQLVKSTTHQYTVPLVMWSVVS